MKKSHDFEAKRERFLAQVKQIDTSLVDYIDALKMQSSAELLSGSSTVAKAYLDEIILLESKTSDLLRLIEKIVDHIDNSGVLEKKKQSAPRATSSHSDAGIGKAEAREPDQEPGEITYEPVKKREEPPQRRVEESVVKDEEPEEDSFDMDQAIMELQNDDVQTPEAPVEVKREQPKKKRKKLDTKITILKSLIYLGGIANEEEINKYMQQYSIRAGDTDISVQELRSNLDTMCEKEMISVDPLDDNIEILQNGIDYLAKYEI